MIIRSLVVQGAEGQPSLLDELTDVIEEYEFDRLDVAVAYATVEGLNSILEAVSDQDMKSRWLIGLDDAVTQPEVLSKIRELPNSELRTCSLGPSRRFHPKLYRFWSSVDDTRASLVIGSGNLTGHGLERNVEAGVVLDAEDLEDSKQLKITWKNTWELGEKLTNSIEEEYKEAYVKARKARRKAAKKTKFVTESDDSLEVKSKTETGWVDIGSAMANGREIEFPKNMLGFFDIEEGTLSPKSIDLITSDNTTVSAQLKKREDNGMWRIHIPQSVPGSDQLRVRINGKLERSKKALVLEKRADGLNRFNVRFIKIETEEYKTLIANSRESGLQMRTKVGKSGRNFGVF